MNEQKNITTEHNEDASVVSYTNRYFVAVDESKYINGMLIAFSQVEAQNYKAQSLAEISQEQFESIGPDCQFVDGKVVAGAPLAPSLTREAGQAILYGRIRNASEKIETLSDAISLGMEQEGDSERLLSWKRYRVQLSQIAPSKPLSEWPAEPLASTTA